MIIHSALRASNEIRKEGGLGSPCGVRTIWLRGDLEPFKKRSKVLEAKVAQECILLTETQEVALQWGDISEIRSPIIQGSSEAFAEFISRLMSIRNG